MKKPNSYTNILKVLEVLNNHTDEANGLMATEIKKIINSEAGEEQISKTETITNILDRLMETDFFGCTINEINGPGRRRYYLERALTLAEAIVLINLVQNAGSISRRHSEDMILVIKNILSARQRKILNDRVIFKGKDFKTPNVSTLLNVELITEAFINEEKITFIYLKYNNKKELTERGATRIVIPYAIVPQQGRYYLLAKKDHEEVVRVFRIDKMTDINLTGIKLTTEETQEVARYNAAEHVSRSVFMYIGTKPEIITLKCTYQQGIHSAVVETFPNAVIEDTADGGFIAKFRAEPSGIVYWALQYCVACEVLSPSHVRDEVRQCLQEAYQRYTGVLP